MIEHPRDKLEAERLKLVRAHYADAIPLHLLKSEQDYALYYVVLLALRRVDLAKSPAVLHLDCSTERM